ncbi:MAG TPA: 6,7-dimethyl-8-ribityllumazine synthase [Methylomirabilota bacterium]|jgi:6,7-dimethyl-8-ribityllumazine synthase|nr:6,7-dimethyl-8-ribityllumazine synthase [Methylomirabilota bacterium]
MAGRAPEARRPRAARRSQRFAIVAARFNERITKRLVDGARSAFAEAGFDTERVEVHWVPGSFELPQAASLLAATRRYAGIVCVGVVIRGQTPHFEHIAREAAAGIRQVALSTGVPATFGVITALSEEQAWDRAGGEVGNRGEEAAAAALEMAKWIEDVRRNRAGRSPVLRGKSAGAEPRAPLSGHPRPPRARGPRNN